MNNTEQQAFYEKLFTEYYPYIWTVVYNALTSDASVDDIVNETFMEAWKSIDELQSHERPLRWLVKTAKHKILHYHRDAAKQERIKGALKHSGAARQSREHRAFVYLSQINPKDAEIILMHYEQGMSLQDIAEALGITESAVKMRLLRARKNLEKLLGEKII